MCHDELRNLLAEYAFGESTELTPDEKARIEAHLAGCSDCQKELQSTKHLYNQLRPPKVIKVPQEILDSTPANVMAAIHRRMVSRRLLRVACFIPAIGVCLRCLVPAVPVPAVPGTARDHKWQHTNLLRRGRSFALAARQCPAPHTWRYRCVRRTSRCPRQQKLRAMTRC